MEQTSAEPRLAKNYRLVYEILQAQGHGRHLAMADVHDLAKARQPGIGFTTIYRALLRLRDMGLVFEITLPGADSAVYELAGEPHAHFRCTSCGNVRDLDYTMPNGVVRALGKAHDVDVRHVSVSLHGLCAGCRAGVSDSSSSTL